MDLIFILFLFLSSLVVTIIFTLILGQRGPWNNPMFFFLVLFMTSWNKFLWLGQDLNSTSNTSFICGIAVTGLIALLLAASETPPPEPVSGYSTKTITYLIKYQQN